MLAGLGSIGNVAFDHLAAARLASQQANDARAVLAGLSAVGFLSLGVQLSLVGWLGRFPGQWSLSSISFDKMFAIASLALSTVAGVLAATFVEAEPSYRLQVGFLVAPAVLASLLAVPAKAELLNGERWLRLGVLLILGPAARLLAGILLLSSEGDTVNIIPIVAGEILVAAGAFSMRPHGLPNAPARQTIRYVWNAGISSIGLLVVLVFSSVAFRSRLGDSADLFNESARVTRSVLFLPLTILVLYLPKIARSPLGSRELRTAYLAGLSWTASLSAAVALLLVLFPHQIGGLLIVESGPLSSDVTRLLAVAWSLVSASIVSLLFYIAHGSRLSLTAWGAALVVTIGQLLATSAWQLGVVALLASATLLIAVSIPAVIRVQPVLHATRSRGTGDIAVARGDVALVIPCFNPGPAVISTVRNAHAHLAELGMNAAILIVSDGSTDGTPELIDQLDLPNLTHIRHRENRGKGAALRTGFEHANAELVAFIDADGDLSPQLLGSLIFAQQSLGADIVFGSKRHPESVVSTSHLRRLYSFAYRAMIRFLFQLDIGDTQTGIKLFRQELIDIILPCLSEEGFALDLEIFIAARAAGFTQFVEVPVSLKRDNGSTISTTAILTMVGDTLRLFWRAKITLAYARSALSTPAVPHAVATAMQA